MEKKTGDAFASPAGEQEGIDDVDDAFELWQAS